MQKNEFLSDNISSTYYKANDLIHDIAFEIESVYGSVASYPWIISLIRNRKDCKINGKKLESVGDHLWGYSRTVTVVEKAKDKEETFADKVRELYNFELDVDVKITNLDGSRVIADKFDKCILITPDFDLKKDFASFLVEYYDLTNKQNIIKTLSQEIVRLITK
ncbi:MAG: hypothetical protein WD512_18885, partial [Candidatus Paceibacterota bacterium]